MKLDRRIALALLLLPTLLIAQTKKKHAVPAAFSNARYIWVETVDGSDAFTPGIIPDDRQAIGDVEDALQDWKRYVITTRKSDADLVFIVRKGRIAAAKIGGTVGGGSGPLNPPFPGQGPGSGPGASGSGSPGPGISGGTEVGSPDDLLQVRLLNSDGTLGAVLWERLFPDGLDAPQVSLVAQLRKAVDHDYPLNAPPSPSKP